MKIYTFAICTFFPFLKHTVDDDDDDDDGIDIMVVGLEVKWHMGRWLLVPLYQSHNWISMWPNTIFLSSIFHLLSPTKSDFNLGDKWFHEGCERLLTKWNMKKVGKDQNLCVCRQLPSSTLFQKVSGYHIGADWNIFSQKFVKACAGATGSDWGFPEPKWCYLSYEVPF